MVLLQGLLLYQYGAPPLAIPADTEATLMGTRLWCTSLDILLSHMVHHLGNTHQMPWLMPLRLDHMFTRYPLARDTRTLSRRSLGTLQLMRMDSESNERV